MPQQDESAEVKELRKRMRDGRTPLLQAIRETYPNYLLLRKGLERKNSEVREQLGLLNNTFSASIKRLRESARSMDDSGEAVLQLYQEMSKQAKEVAAFIDKELPGLNKLFKPVSEAYATYKATLDDYRHFMQQFVGKLPDGDLSGRALELVQTEIEKSLR